MTHRTQNDSGAFQKMKGKDDSSTFGKAIHPLTKPPLGRLPPSSLFAIPRRIHRFSFTPPADCRALHPPTPLYRTQRGTTKSDLTAPCDEIFYCQWISVKTGSWPYPKPADIVPFNFQGSNQTKDRWQEKLLLSRRKRDRYVCLDQNSP
jgi:hypothetical protein